MNIRVFTRYSSGRVPSLAFGFGFYTVFFAFRIATVNPHVLAKSI